MKTFGDYEILRVLGSTSHATVYLVRPPERLRVEGPLVALKTLRHHADAADFRRIANELRILNRITSPCVVPLLDAGTVDGQIFVVRPLYPDGTLASERNTVNLHETCRIVADAARGAHELHQLGVAHRDIRPGNIFVEQGRGRLGNFDLAQLVSGQSTAGAGPLGALQFAAPELVFGEAASRATDIWSLAMTLHQAAAGISALGELPRTSLLDACRHVIHTEPVVSPQVAAPLGGFLRRCLGPIEARPATALHFAQELELVTGELS